MVDVLIGLLLVGFGFAAGRTARTRLPEPCRPEEQERRQLLEDRAAFAQLMGYNANRAYGIYENDD